MQRDMDLIRRIIQATAALPYGESLEGLDDVDTNTFATHVVWLQEAGLVSALAATGVGSFAVYASVQRLTWDGCEFADATQSDNLWARAKTSVLKPGISFTFDVLKDWLKTEITQGLPTIRGLSQ